MCHVKRGMGDDGWYGKWREQAERRKCHVTLDIGCVTRWKLGPEETIYHIHTHLLRLLRLLRLLPSRWTADRRERKEGETVAIELCRSRYIVQLCFLPASPIVNVTNTGDIFSVTLLLYHPPFNDQARDRLLVVRRVQSRLLFKKFTSKWGK